MHNAISKWLGLSTASLYQGAVTTDFRDPIATVLRTHMQFSDAQIDQVFPGRPRPSGNVAGLIKVWESRANRVRISLSPVRERPRLVFEARVRVQIPSSSHLLDLSIGTFALGAATRE
jgi:hypothetical protein